MRLETQVLIRRSPDEVWAWLGDVSNVPHWDRGVAEVQANTKSKPGVGFEFDTLGRSARTTRDRNWGKMSYRITETDPVRGCTVQLTSNSGNARFFRSAEWRFRVEPDPQGSVVICAAHFQLRLRYLLLAPLFYSMTSAIRRDLESLKSDIESCSPATTSANSGSPP